MFAPFLSPAALLFQWPAGLGLGLAPFLSPAVVAVGHRWVVGRRDRAGCQALGGGKGHLIVHHTLFLFWDQFVFSSVFVCWLLYGEILSGI